MPHPWHWRGALAVLPRLCCPRRPQFPPTEQLLSSSEPNPWWGALGGLVLTLEPPEERLGSLHGGLTSWRGHGPPRPGGSSWPAGLGLPEESPLGTRGTQARTDGPSPGGKGHTWPGSWAGPGRAGHSRNAPGRHPGGGALERGDGGGDTSRLPGLHRLLGRGLSLCACHLAEPAEEAPCVPRLGS